MASSAPTAGTTICYLYGVLTDLALPKLLERISTLCGILDFQDIEPFWIHELAFIPTTLTPFGPASKEDIVYRIQANVLDANRHFQNIYQRSWVANILGAPEPSKKDEQRPVTQRVVYESEIQGDVLQHVDMLGYMMNFELTKKGYIFHHKGMTIKVYRIYKLQKRFKVSSAELLPTMKDSWVTELSSPATDPRDLLRVASEMNKFASYLTGIVRLNAVDHTVLRNTIFYKS
ncbi:hypothetical protein DFS34DRAFT_647806 [Phlyctochytrium arcticum]|nr:hypothetical protein DFS34DRAFT_647806 [Phlyctochytrium arcticum]